MATLVISRLARVAGYIGFMSSDMWEETLQKSEKYAQDKKDLRAWKLDTSGRGSLRRETAIP